MCGKGNERTRNAPPGSRAGWLCTVSAALLLIAGITGALADDDAPRISVDDAAFTPAVADRQPTQRLSRVSAGQQPFLWTLISANAATLNALREQGKLPIMHAWRRYAGEVVLENADATKLEGDIPLELGNPALIAQLQYEIDHTPRRVFTWRTWSRKGALTAGTWSVFIKYADGTPVICRVVSGVAVPCVYRLEVRAP